MLRSQIPKHHPLKAQSLQKWEEGQLLASVTECAMRTGRMELYGKNRENMGIERATSRKNSIQTLGKRNP